MRCFLALLPSPEVASTLARFVENLHLGKSFQVIPTVFYHVTLRFFSDLTDENRADLADWLAVRVSRFAPFEVETRGWTLFPERGLAHILAVRVQPSRPLLRLAALTKTWPGGEESDPVERRKFRPHLTVGRWPRPVHRRRLPSLSEQEPGWLTFPAEAVMLFESRPGRAGQTYHRLASLPIGP